MEPHDWSDCEPVLLALPGADPIESAAMALRVKEMWRDLPADDKIGFHRACCLQSDLPADMAAVLRIREALQ